MILNDSLVITWVIVIVILMVTCLTFILTPALNNLEKFTKIDRKSQRRQVMAHL